MSRVTVSPKSRLMLNRLVNAVVGCLCSYLVAHMLLMDLVQRARSTPTNAAAAGHMIALACLPVLILTWFGLYTRYRGAMVVITAGGVAALSRLVVS
ncbi:hypothetical protein [Komagataeibacter saccharivorans]|uniref:hypothetical protein n=1 Tax=Komagataeibacter saccharivorans TaxID=265959 RepID=UPI000C836240|nr:hypothetical protein [Komagataeibacter saccharivorans]